LKPLIHITLAGLALVATTALAQAQTTTFANFQQVGSDKSFQFFNTGATSSFLTQNTITSVTTIPVNFTFLLPNGSGQVNTPLPANLTITAIVSGTATSGLTVSQRLQSIEMTFIGTGAVTGNLLTLSGSTGTIGGVVGDIGAGLEETHNGTTQLVNYSSAYLDLSQSSQRNYSIALNNLTTPLGVDGNGYLTGFQSNATGQFAAVIPEPSTLSLGILGIIGAVVARRRKNPH
jgi:multisubunit Na+/H+ antiporter MnhC subunit